MNKNIKVLVVTCTPTINIESQLGFEYLHKQVELSYLEPISIKRMEGRWRFIELMREYFLTYLYCPQYDVVISLSFLLGLGLCSLQVLGFRKRTKHIIVDIASSRIHNSRLSTIFIALMSSATRIICFTNAQKNQWNKKLPNKARFISLGVNVEKFVPATSEKDYVFSAGRQSRDYATLIRASRNTRIKTIILAGRDSVTKKTSIEGLTLPCNVTVYYERPYEEYKDLLDASKIVVISLKDVPYACGQEALLEAFAAGKPVIATRTAAMKDYIEDGKTGVLVSPNNPDELGSAILSLFHNDKLRKCIGNNARKVVEVKYNLKTSAKKILETIEEGFYEK